MQVLDVDGEHLGEAGIIRGSDVPTGMNGFTDKEDVVKDCTHKLER